MKRSLRFAVSMAAVYGILFMIAYAFDIRNKLFEFGISMTVTCIALIIEDWLNEKEIK